MVFDRRKGYGGDSVVWQFQDRAGTADPSTSQAEQRACAARDGRLTGQTNLCYPNLCYPIRNRQFFSFKIDWSISTMTGLSQC